jgi:hypothetical protein
VNNRRLVSSGEDEPAPASLEDDNADDVHRRQLYRELHRKAVGYAMRAQPADIGNRILRAVAFRFDAEAPLVERRPFAGADEPPLVEDRLLLKRQAIPSSGRNQSRVAHFEIGETAGHTGFNLSRLRTVL